MKIVLPWISKELHAHAKGNWRPKAEATKVARSHAYITTLHGLNKKCFEKITGRARIHYTFFVPDLLQRDEANMIQSCKAYVDGVKDAGAIVGDHWAKLSTGSVTVTLDRSAPRVELTFEAIL